MGKRERVRRRAAARKATRKEARKGERTALARASEKTSLRFDGGPETVLVLGDGDLSFSGGLTAHLAAAGARNGPNSVTATTLDTEKQAEEKYGAKYTANARTVRERGATVLHGVDARNLKASLTRAVAKQNKHQRHAGPFDAIVFNFPHTGKQRSHLNKALIASMLESAPDVLAPGGRVCVTLKLAPPYDRWDVPAMETSKLAFTRRLNFDVAKFPGYRHQTTEKGAKPLMKHVQAASTGSASAAASLALQKEEAKCKTFVFELRPHDEGDKAAADDMDEEERERRKTTNAALAALGWA